ncbi:caspase domain-containing protein [Streptomyces sp. NPDC048751]|uniref:caspase family protein n=1 Tax=Streptomyces sp. NPDC048751 TaxID=3365591 RepID=UPI003716AB93
MTETRHALIIANDHYDDRGLKKLRAPAQDAAALAEVLQNPQIGDFDVEVVRNAPADVMRRRIQKFFTQRVRDDTLLLHFSCHGLKSESGELYFAARDTEMGLLDATAISSQFVRGCMSRTRAGRTVMFLDCCYGGAFTRGSSSVRASGDVNVLESFEAAKSPGGRGWAVITASDSMEYAFEGSDLTENSAPRPSLFTQAVVDGLKTGEADRDEDGEVRLNELCDYVQDHVQAENPNQTPKRTVEMQGDPWLAHSRRARIKIAAEPSPPFLQNAMNSDDIVTRQGAVVQLGRRLRSGVLSVAEGARQDLERIARNDLPDVAGDAKGALRKVRLAPAPTRLNFGTVPQGSTPEQRSVTLGGPPLARHCVAYPTRSWVRVDPMPTGLKVGVETSGQGHLTADIVLKGVAEETLIPVEVTVEPTTGRGPTTDQEPTASDDATEPHDVVVHPPPPEEPPPEPPPEEPPRRAPFTFSRAPALAGAALALAVTAVITVILAIQAGAVAVGDRADAGVDGNLEDNIRDQGALAPLIISLITAALAVVVSALARHDLGTRREHVTDSAARHTGTMTSVAKGLAIPALVLGVLMMVAYLVGSQYW